ncbi:MAG TPA: hypothetical protein VH796_05675 [Nitrososphaeraceae archaeon]|jgi:hypothetical protein
MDNEITKCAMCGKNIIDTKKALKREICDKLIEFDSPDCAGIYERLRSVYGSSIEI